VGKLCVLDPISSSKDGIDNPLGPQDAKAAGAEVTIALSAFDWVLKGHGLVLEPRIAKPVCDTLSEPGPRTAERR
jgi:hypothetical protein